MNATLDWETVKEFYKNEFGIDGWVVEMYANMDILSLCASGASNKTIETFLEIPIAEVKKVIQDAFDFDGWEKDLPINPYKVFCSYDGEHIDSLTHYHEFTKDTTIELAKYGIIDGYSHIQLYSLCRTMYDIERKIQDEWI